MSRVFLTGPLSWMPLLEVVLGTRPSSRRVTLLNISDGPSEAFPFPHVQDGATAAGIAIDLENPEDYEALSFFAEALKAHPVPKHGDVDGEAMAGVLFVADRHDGQAAFDLDQWADQWGDVAVEAAGEIMGYRGRMIPSQLHWRMPMILSRAEAVRAAKTVCAPTLRRNTTRDAIAVHDQRATHEGFFLTRSYDLQYPRFDGSMSDSVHREVFVAADAVIVLPYDPERDRVLLVEQFRMGPFGRGDTYPWVLEPVAGRVDAGETIEETARRECEEEAGLTLRHMEHVSSHYFSPGASTEFYHCFVALADLPNGLAGQGGLDSEAEDIRTHVLEFERAMDLLTTKEANIGPLILLLLWLQRERSRLRSSA